MEVIDNPPKRRTEQAGAITQTISIVIGPNSGMVLPSEPAALLCLYIETL